MHFDTFLARFADVTEEGDGWVATCPAHADTKPSLRLAVGEKALLVKCRAGCATGDVLDAVGLSMADLYDVEGEPERRALSTSAPAGAADIAALAVQLDGWAAALAGGDGDDAVEYAERRFGLTRGDIERLGLGYAERLAGEARLVVPFCDARGVPRGYQARALGAKARVRWHGPKNPEGASWSTTGVLRAGDRVDELDVIVVTEGPGDGLTACGAGYDVVFVRGAALSGRADVVQTIVDLAHEAGRERPVVVIGDNDDSGQLFARDLAGRVAGAGVERVNAARPLRGNDVSEWRETAGPDFGAELIVTLRDAVAAAPGAIETRLNAFVAADQTDLGMAHRLRNAIEEADSDVHHTPEAGFFLLAAGVWQADLLDEVRTTAQGVARHLWGEADELDDLIDLLPTDTRAEQARQRRLKKRAGRLRSFARRANSTPGLDSMVRELQALPGVAVDVKSFDSHPHLVACRNGVVDLRSGELLDPDPSLLLTKRVQLDYRPEAAATRWRAFLLEVFPDAPELADFMQRLIGYGITGNTDEQCFAVMYGKGANGKSVFTDTLTEVFRELTVTTPFSTFEAKQSGGIPNDLAALRGARLVMAAEGEAGKPMAEAVLKRVTGRDLISARFMRKEFFEFRPTFLLMLATNHKPKFYGQDEGLWRRVKLIPWARYFAPDERDHRLGDELLTEAEGIFAWAVAGAVEWYARGLGEPAVVKRETADYRGTSDALAGFYPGTLEPDPDGRLVGSDAFDEYLRWCEEEHLPHKEVWTRRTFYGAMEERGVAKVKSKHGVELIGVRLATAGDDPFPDSPLRKGASL